MKRLIRSFFDMSVLMALVCKEKKETQIWPQSWKRRRSEGQWKKVKIENCRRRKDVPYIYGDVGKLWPGKSVVEVVFAEVVLREVGDVGRLDVRNVGRPEHTNIHVDRRRAFDEAPSCL